MLWAKTRNSRIGQKRGYIGIFKKKKKEKTKTTEAIWAFSGKTCVFQ